MQTTFASNVAAKPLMFGISQWFSGLFASHSPRTAAIEARVDNIRALQRMARDLESSQPNLAAELRNFAARS